MDKKEARKYYKKIRNEIPFSDRKKQSEGISLKLMELIKKEEYKNVLFYAPLTEEVDIMDVFNELSDTVNCYFPRIKGMEMDFFSVKSEEDLLIQSFNVREPKEYCNKIIFSPEERYLCVVPGIAFDKKGGRIGYGKGYYDRYFVLHENDSIDTVGVCFDECLADNIEIDSHDKNVKMILTFSK